MSIEKFQRKISEAIFGRSKVKCSQEGICICCGKKPDFNYGLDGNALAYKEFQISALCPECFDKITKETNEHNSN